MAKTKYDSAVNMLGGIPDMSEMVQYINSLSNKKIDSNFIFRTTHATTTFKGAIESFILQFASEKHKKHFLDALSSDKFTLANKFIIIFWQMTYSDYLFKRITEEVFMKAVYQGRSSIQGDEILAFLHYIKGQEPEELKWSETTLKGTASKYLTLVKKLGLAEGTVKKQIKHPIITNELFVWFIRWCQLVCSEDRTLHNPYIQFGFMDEYTLILRLKKIENMAYWDITQIGNDITIDLKPYE